MSTLLRLEVLAESAIDSDFPSLAAALLKAGLARALQTTDPSTALARNQSI